MAEQFRFRFMHGVAIVIGIVVLMTVLSTFTIVGPGQKGVVMNWGQVQPVVLNEGLHWLIPFVQKVEQVSARVLKNDVEANAASKDLQEVNVEIAINWHLLPDRVSDVYRNIGNVDEVFERIVSSRVAEEVKAVTAGYNAEELITKRQELKSTIERELAQSLLVQHLVLDNLSIVNIDFSDDFNKAIEQKQVAEQNSKRAEYVAKQAAQEAQAAINIAKGQAESQRLQQEALDDKILQKLWIDKWNGVLPQYMSSSMPVPFKVTQ